MTPPDLGRSQQRGTDYGHQIKLAVLAPPNLLQKADGQAFRSAKVLWSVKKRDKHWMIQRTNKRHKKPLFFHQAKLKE